MSVDAPFSQATRKENLGAMCENRADVLVIGAGVTGAGIARDAAMRGFRTVLVDKGDFGSGTSSRSSRMVHGGLQYLEGGDVLSVIRTNRERRILLRIAPHLVWTNSFLVPIHKGSRVSLWRVAARQLAYDSLALFRNGRSRLLGRRATLRLEPGIRSAGLTGAGLYQEAQCNDARLTLVNVRSAHANGALVANYVTVTGYDRAAGDVTGVRAVDSITEDRYTIHARTIVNATGPWSDDVAGRRDGAARLRRTKGVHVVVPRARVGNNDAVAMVSPVDGRMLVVVPFGELSYIGATDTEESTDPDRVRATAADIVYLLRSVNAMFPAARLGAADVVSTWAGVGAVIRDDEASRATVSGEHRIVTDDAGVIEVIGGSLTTYRALAASVVDLIGRRLNELDGRRRPERAPTHTEPLPGGEVADVSVLVDDLTAEGLNREAAEYLVAQCGSEATAVMRIASGRPELTEPIVPGHPAVKALLVHAMRREMAMTLDDLLTRRTRVYHEVMGHGVPEIPAVVDLAAEELGWDAGRKALELADYLQLIQYGMAFRDEIEQL